MKLYTFFRSSASYRVRIALNLKNLSYDQVQIHLPAAVASIHWRITSTSTRKLWFQRWKTMAVT
jgi:hypothetical protein